MNQQGHSLSIWIAGLGVVLAIVFSLVYTGWREGDISSVDTTLTQIRGPVVVGVLLPLSGDEKPLGQTLKQAANHAFTEINDAGGVRGFNMEVIWRDTECNADKALEEMNTLKDESISIVIGGVCADESRIIAEKAQEYGMVHVSLSNLVDDLSSIGDFVYSGAVTEKRLAHVLGLYSFESLNASSFFIYSDSPTEGRLFRDMYRKYIEADEDSAIRLYELTETKEDYVEDVDALQESGADIVYLDIEDTGLVRALLDEMDARRLSVDVVASPALVKSFLMEPGVDAFDGIYTTISDFDPLYDELLAFQDVYEQEYGSLGEYLERASSIYSYVYLIKDSFIAVGAQPMRIRDYLNGLSQWEGGSLEGLTFDESGQAVREVIVVNVQDGELKEVERY